MNNITIFDWTPSLNLLLIIGLITIFFNPKLIIHIISYYLLWFVYKHFALNLIDGMGVMWLIFFNSFIVFQWFYNTPSYRKESRWGFRWQRVMVNGKPNDSKLGQHGPWFLSKFSKFYQTVIIANVKYDKLGPYKENDFRILRHFYGYSHHDNENIYYTIDSHWTPYKTLIDSIINIFLIALIVLPLIAVTFNIYLFCMVLLFNTFSYLFTCLNTLTINFLDVLNVLNVSDVYPVVIANVITPVKLETATKPSTSSNIKEEEVELETIKYYTTNGIIIPGFLFHAGATSKKLLENLEKSLENSPNHNAIIDTVDFIESEINKARSIMKHGFIYSVDLTDDQAFPITANLIEDILIQNKVNTDLSDEGIWRAYKEELNFELEGKNTSPLDRLNNSSTKTKAEAFKQVYHLLCLNYWTINKTLINHFKNNNFIERFSDFKESDAFVKVNHLNSLLTKLLPNSVKRHLHNKSICLTNNIYAGFDTEFKNIDNKTNKLLSVQVSVNGCYTLKIPTLNNKHVFGSLDVSTNKFYETKPDSNIIDYNLINTLIQDAIDFNSNANTNYKNYIDNLTKTLINKNIKFFIKDNNYIFKLPSSKILSKFIEVKNDFAMKDLLNNILQLDELNTDKKEGFNIINNILNENNIQDEFLFDYKDLNTDTVYDTVFDSKDNSNSTSNTEKGETTQKKRIRIKRELNRSSIFNNNMIYITAHYNAADLPMLCDFENYKQFLNVVNKSFVALNRPIPFKQIINSDNGNTYKNWNVKISDTMLLSPPGFATLKKLGTIYNFDKLDLSKEEITNMDLLLINDRNKFKQYAIRDSIITLLHFNAMIDYNFSLENQNPPSTLSQISGRAVDKYWNSINYEGYQMSPLYTLANSDKVYTFKGLFETYGVGDKLPLFIQTFRGGRNESFCYGMDFSGKTWYDYDLTSAYTTIMYGLADPIYFKAANVNKDTFNKEIEKDKNFLLKNYLAIKCSFNFPEDTNYPCLPCNYDSDNTVYPLKGQGVYTGPEILAALNLDCKITFKEIFKIPKGNVKIFGLIKDLHIERGKHKKGSFNNLMCKIIGNSAYGLTAQGINEIKRFDTVSNSTVRMKDSRFSNPIIAANISGFIRALLAEIMNNINIIDAKIVSVTTDGFITEIPDLENLLLDKINKGEWKGDLLLLYRKWRSEITNGSKPEALEVKNYGPNMMSWTTRGQLSTDSGIVAMTGLQRGSFNNLDHIACIVKDLFNSEDKTLEFISSRLRTASDIFKKGGHVTSMLSDKSWSIIFDNKRKVILGGNITNYRIKLFFTQPHLTVEEAWGYRNFNKTVKTGDYEVGENKLTLGRYKNLLDLTIKSWIKALTHNQLGLETGNLSNNDIKNIIINWKNDFPISNKDIYDIKMRKPLIINSVVKSKEGVEFITHIKTIFPKFNDNFFWKD